MNKIAPLISIIIPVFNTELFIENTIKSIILQTFRNFELIFVNDETQDNAISIVENSLALTSIDYKIIHQKNQGLGYSRNNGVDQALGDWILFIDSDDTLQPDALELMNEVILNSENELDFIVTGFQNVVVGQEFKIAAPQKKTIFFSKLEIQEVFLKRSPVILVAGTLYNKQWYQNNRFRFTNIPYSEDQLFMWEILLKTNNVAILNKDLYNYLIRKGSIMSSSKFVQIVLGYPYFEEIQKKYQQDSTANKLVAKYLLSRWVFGILHSSAKLCTIEDYKRLLVKFEAKKHYRNLTSFSDLKIRIFAYVCLKFPSLIFYINKRF